MNHTDVVNILIAVGVMWLGGIGGLIQWLSRHSSRLTTTEANTANNTKQIDANLARSDAQYSQITAMLTRIEDKLDRKVDRQ